MPQLDTQLLTHIITPQIKITLGVGGKYSEINFLQEQALFRRSQPFHSSEHNTANPVLTIRIYRNTVHSSFKIRFPI